MLKRYWRPGEGTFTAGADPSSGPASYWTSAQALDVVLDGVAREDATSRAAVVGAFYGAQDRRGWMRDYFDDEAWMALALLRADALIGDARYLARAVALAEDIRANAVDTSCCGRDRGGLWWDRAHTQKATAANAGAALLGARLYMRTGDPTWLEFARTTFDWWRAHMTDPATGQVADHVDRDGEKVWWRFTYNEGTMIGAAVALHRAAGLDSDLEEARRLAGFMLAHEVRPTAVGDVLFDGDGCAGDCEQFKGIAERYLAELLAEDLGVPGVAALLAADAEAAWTVARDPETGEFAVDRNGPPTAQASLMATSSAATALAVHIP
jgi:predicted alpha-1,6-mannanase (GH76 family)